MEANCVMWPQRAHSISPLLHATTAVRAVVIGAQVSEHVSAVDVNINAMLQCVLVPIGITVSPVSSEFHS
jgi:hypothetical protein